MSAHNMFLWKTGENYPKIVMKYFLSSFRAKALMRAYEIGTH